MKATINEELKIEGTPQELCEFYKDYRKATVKTPQEASSTLSKAIEGVRQDNTPSSNTRLTTNKNKNWSASEIKYLEENYHRNNQVVAREMKRTEHSITLKKSKLGLTWRTVDGISVVAKSKNTRNRKHKRWSVEDDAYLKANSHRKAAPVARELKRSATAVRQRRFNMKKQHDSDTGYGAW